MYKKGHLFRVMETMKIILTPPK